MRSNQLGSGGPSYNGGGDSPTMLGGLAGILGGLFTDESAPYKAAMQQYQQYGQQAAGAQQPFYQAGQQGLGNYQQWLQGMQNPTSFINNMMGSYQESPYAKFMQNQAINSAQAAGSADGTAGSTPMMQQLQQNASNISSGDMQNWLQNVLGVNTQYGAGQAGLANMGQQSANNLSDIYEKMAEQMGGAAAGQAYGKNMNTANIFGGLQQMLNGANPMNLFGSGGSGQSNGSSGRSPSGGQTLANIMQLLAAGGG